MRFMRSGSWSALAMMGAIAVGLSTQSPAAAVAPTATPAMSAPTTTPGPAATPTPSPSMSGAMDLTVVLQPSDRAALRGLAFHAHGLSTLAKRNDLIKVTPTASARARTVATLTATGMQVLSQSTWTLKVQATMAQAQSVFGVHLQGSAGRRYPDRAVTLPTGLRSEVSTVLGLDQRPVVHRRTLPHGFGPVDLRAAYGVSRRRSSGAGTTIATVQFSGWNSSDLGSYAAAIGQPLPLVSQISVDGASPSTPDGYGGDQEVALDQEMIAAGAPSAAQRIYFAPNTAQGFYDVFNTIATDAEAGTIQAVSTSWGTCESSTSTTFAASVQDAVDRAVLAGATTFAAAGDFGAYDCSTASTTDSTPDVDFPAVLPEVVAVGGTTLTKPTSTTYAETAWSDTASHTGGGGGMSSRTARPSYQSAVAIPGTGRLVPDVAADADPGTGVGAYVASAGGFIQMGGTSAAAPLTAAEFVSTLTSLGCTKGIGDIHAALYAHPEAFRDITSGNNLLYPATPGFDEATGLGSPNWAVLAASLPTQQACATLASVSGTSLSSGQTVVSPNKQYTAIMQSDGNLVLYGNGRALWSTRTAGNPGSRFTAQSDGNAVIYSASGKALWNTRTNGEGTAPKFEVLSTGELDLVSTVGTTWQAIQPGASTLSAGSDLAAGQFLHDATGRMTFIMQTDGNLVAYHGGKPAWSSKTNNHPGSKADLQSDGNLVVYSDAGRVLWSSHTNGRGPGTRLVTQESGDVVLYQGSVRIWGTSPNSTSASTLTSGSRLGSGNSLADSTGRSRLIMQTDGNLVLYQSGTARWNSGTGHFPGSHLILQSDGNLVIYDTTGRPRWDTRTSSNGSATRLAVQTDGNVVLYSGTAAIWNTHTTL